MLVFQVMPGNSSGINHLLIIYFEAIRQCSCTIEIRRFYGFTNSRRFRVRKRTIWAIVALAAVAMTPAAFADSFSLLDNNLGLSGVLGTVTTSQNGSDVTVKIDMSTGYAILVNGGDLGFTTDGTLSLTDGSLTGFSLSGMSAKLKKNSTIGGFTFDFLFQTSESGGQAFPTTLTFTVLNADVSQITGLGLHLCVLSDAGGCATTGYTTTGTTTVPEPATMSFVGVSLLTFVGVIRRRFRS